MSSGNKDLTPVTMIRNEAPKGVRPVELGEGIGVRAIQTGPAVPIANANGRNDGEGVKARPVDSSQRTPPPTTIPTPPPTAASKKPK